MEGTSKIYITYINGYSGCKSRLDDEVCVGGIEYCRRTKGM